jgi:hypothetical protein
MNIPILFFNFQRDVSDAEQMFRQNRGDPVFQYHMLRKFYAEIELTIGVNIAIKNLPKIFPFYFRFFCTIYRIHILYILLTRAES